MSILQGDEREAVVREFLSESTENLAQFESALLEAEKDPGSSKLLATMFRSIHSMKGSCGFVGFGNLERLLHVAESVLGALRDGRLALSSELVSALLRMVDDSRRLLERISVEGKDEGVDVSATVARLENSGALAATGQPTPGDAALRGRLDETLDELEQAQDSMVGADKIRVDVRLLDRLMNLVGELVLARNQVTQVGASQSSVGASGPMQRLSLVTTELQETVMKTRMQPIGNVWNRFPRLVREFASLSGRQVRLQLEGRETELDKSIIEAIQDPLTHLVRNALDHGVETVDARLAHGKPPEANITLRAFHEGGMVNIEIADDGAGIDVPQVKQRAVQLGLRSADEVARLSDADAIRLIFLPGFSTTQQVTRLSGRGVGMDVVRANVERIGGSVDVRTAAGAGTRVLIKIPLTLAIIPALIVVSSGARYAIPQASVQEVVRLDPSQGSDIERIQGVPVFRLRGELLPIVFLGRELGHAPSSEAQESSAIVVLQADDRSFGLVVDEIRDTEEIVVKPLWKRLKSLSFYAGATVMGDGRVALILDALGLAQRVGVVTEARQLALSEEAPVPAAQGVAEQRVLLCRLGASGRLAIPLSAVSRLEEIPQDQIERVGNESVTQYRGAILPLWKAADVLQERRRRPRVGDVVPPEVTAEVTPVVVFDGERPMGLMVDGILDILSVKVALQAEARRAGVLGTMVVQERITEFLDVEHLMRRGRSWAGQPGGAS